MLQARNEADRADRLFNNPDLALLHAEAFQSDDVFDMNQYQFLTHWFCFFAEKALPRIISMTAPKIRIMPPTNRHVKLSPNIKTPMRTAVRGSNAPMMAVGGEPISFMAMVSRTNEMMVDTNARESA